MAVGDPIRSKDFQREKQIAERRFQSAQQVVEQAAADTYQAELATQAVEKAAPADTQPGSMYKYTRRTQPSAGTEQMGTVTVSTRSDYTFSIQDEDVLASENDNLLRPGKIWAATSSNATEQFEVRMEPARLIRYNELYVPHIAGRIGLTLFSPQGQTRIGGINGSRVFRYREMQSFNGRMFVQSTSRRTTPTGQYIHTLGGLSFFRSSWTQSGDVTASFTIPEKGMLTDVDVRMLPSGETPSFTLRVNGENLTKNGDVYSEDGSVIQNDKTVEVLAEDVTAPANFMEITFHVT